MGKVKAAGLFLVNKNNKILVGHPTHHKPNFWSIPKGKIDGNETPLEAAIRETYEESNVTVSMTDDFIELGRKVYRHKKKDITLFALLEGSGDDWDGEFDIKCNSNVPEERGGFPEFDRFRWVSLDEARTILHDTQVAVIDLLEYELEKVKYPICSLMMKTDVTTSHFVKTSKRVLWLEYDEIGLPIDSYKKAAVGRGLIMSPFDESFTWQTTAIIEIIEERDRYIKFKTKNNTYELHYNKL